MNNTTLEQVQQLVDHLTPLDQVRLLTYLTPRIAQLVESVYPATPNLTPNNGMACKAFFQIGDELTASDTPESQTLTAAVLMMRR
jgi:hypothetical protein